VFPRALWSRRHCFVISFNDYRHTRMTSATVTDLSSPAMPMPRAVVKVHSVATVCCPLFHCVTRTLTVTQDVSCRHRHFDLTLTAHHRVGPEVTNTATVCSWVQNAGRKLAQTSLSSVVPLSSVFCNSGRIPQADHPRKQQLARSYLPQTISLFLIEPVRILALKTTTSQTNLFIIINTKNTLRLKCRSNYHNCLA